MAAFQLGLNQLMLFVVLGWALEFKWQLHSGFIGFQHVAQVLADSFDFQIEGPPLWEVITPESVIKCKRALIYCLSLPDGNKRQMLDVVYDGLPNCSGYVDLVIGHRRPDCELVELDCA